MAGALTEVTTSSFDSFLKAKPVALVDFSATWCGPCQMLKPTIEALATQYTGKVSVGKVDIDANSEIAMRFSVMSVPTLIFFKDGKQVDSMIGVAPKDAIAKKIDALL